MKIRFALSYEDYEQFILYYGKNVGTRQRIYWFARVMFFGLMFIIALNEFLKTDSKAGLVVIFLATGIVLYLIFPLLFDWALKQGAKRMYQSMDAERLTEEKIVELAPEGILITSQGQTGISYWKDVGELRETARYLFLLIKPNGAHIIPKSAFANDTEAKMFTDEAQKKILNARGGA
ncbi:MAG: YcxB family protein [Cytophagales bacterium]|nr:YcxB family protein [Cytophagales bacterium]